MKKDKDKVIVPRLNKLAQKENEKVVYKLMMEGWTVKKIIDELMENHGYKTEHNARKIIKKVIKSFKPETEIEINELKGQYIEMFNNLYNKTLNAKDYRGANSILANLVKLQGLDVQKIEIKDTTFDVEF